ncbi:MAG TPA: hypothetical protein VK137_08215 [Planctomycetaceae bacterium]|nr:hypothetical protein [Planctomycetaceae bacterium]
MRQTLGMLMQLAVLTFLPLLILYQLQFGFRVLVMPPCLVVGIVIFWIGTKLRESSP